MSFIPPFPIRLQINIDNYTIILLDPALIPHESIYYHRNVMCIDQNGKVVWQIEDLESNPLNSEDCQYVNMIYYQNKLRLFNACDLRVEVDYRTGKILGTVEIR